MSVVVLMQEFTNSIITSLVAMFVFYDSASYPPFVVCCNLLSELNIAVRIVQVSQVNSRTKCLVIQFLKEKTLRQVYLLQVVCKGIIMILRITNTTMFL